MNTQNSVLSDWHPADVKAALEKRGMSLAALARQSGYSHIQRVLISPWLGAEQVVASALGLPPEQIWPTRYQTSRGRAHLQTRNAKAAKLARRTLARTEG